MASYEPPIENLPIFNQSVFTTNTDSTLTISAADKRYLKFPLGQGTETLPNLIVNGVSTIFNTSRLYINTVSSIFSNTILNSTTSTNPTNYFNTFIGNFAGNKITSGSNNTGIAEYGCLSELTSGNSNVAYGNNSLNNLTTGEYNVAIGPNALKYQTIQSFNSGLGYNAGSLLSAGNLCTFLGANANTTNISAQQSTAVGAGSTIQNSYEIVLGTSDEKVVIPNQIQFRYTLNPTYSNTSLGYTERYSWASSAAINTTGFVIASFSNLPIGLYIWATNFLVAGTTNVTRDDLVFTAQTNITNLNCTSTLEYNGNTGTKLNANPTFLLQITSLTNSLIYTLTQVNAPGGTIQPSASTITRIA